jgi:hypothetical protein
MRRLAQGRQAKAFFGFVPRYELAILPQGTGSFYPSFLAHFADKATAEVMYHRIAQAIIQGGVYGEALRSILREGNRKVYADYPEAIYGN